jgi:hypothetical protein
MDCAPVMSQRSLMHRPATVWALEGRRNDEYIARCETEKCRMEDAGGTVPFGDVVIVVALVIGLAPFWLPLIPILLQAVRGSRRESR